MADEVESEVARIIAEQALVDAVEIRPDTTLEELGLDSLGLVEVVFGIEESFDVSVPYNANDPEASQFDLSTMGAITEAVRHLISEKA